MQSATVQSRKIIAEEDMMYNLFSNSYYFIKHHLGRFPVWYRWCLFFVGKRKTEMASIVPLAFWTGVDWALAKLRISVPDNNGSLSLALGRSVGT